MERLGRAASLVEHSGHPSQLVHDPTKWNKLPDRSADTMSDAISISSPSGRVSKRAKAKAAEKLSTALFGKGGLKRPTAIQPSEKSRLLQQAKELRDLAARGMSPRKYTKKAAELEARARG